VRRRERGADHHDVREPRRVGGRRGGANESRYAGAPSANTITSDGIRLAGGVLAADDFVEYDAWQPTGAPPTKVLARFRVRGTWAARSSKWRLCLGSIRGLNFSALEVNLWNHAAASHGVAANRLWIKHTVPNPDFGGQTTTPGPLASSVFTGSDYEFVLRAEDLGNPDGAGWHDVRMAVWGGPVGGVATKWLDVTGKMQPVGFSNPKTFALDYVEAPRPNLGGDVVYGAPVAYGTGPTETAGQTGDALVIRGVVLAQDDCVDAYPVPATVATPPAPLAMPAITTTYTQALLFLTGGGTGPVHLGPSDYGRAIHSDNSFGSASATETGASVSAGWHDGINCQSYCIAGAVFDDVGDYPANAYVLEFDGSVTGTNLAGAVVASPNVLSTWRYHAPSGSEAWPPIGSGSSKHWEARIECVGPDSGTGSNSGSMSNVFVRRYMAPEGY
jgi:hypothetical protein